ncbi:photosynthetic reaction center cytochrome PufC [Sulfitobacter sp. D35]|uniref:photosynthetic reaction center cytochrome PufC n=1 Tax=Sulfitobacter sp. D35 TaxID=3083252 RepID=UPI00296EE4D5|nr:photosynthetic reaction center cytochrome PufC [Sulfitobacter sp. D35]MDW4499411.1 photosynthetic reaction center cytochrome PufC [Sulfitobacter sp. D35]
MLPNWFNKWHRENPTDIERPAIIFGTVGVAVIAVTAIVVLGWPTESRSLQTGPRGTGMSVTKFEAVAIAPDRDIAELIDDEPFIPEGDEELAGDIYENVQVLGDLTDDNFNRLMAAITRWVSPEEGCAYCHGDGGLETYGEDNLYTKVVSRRMIQMTQNINENWDGHVNANKTVGVTCFTCHRGQNVPSDVWFKVTPVSKATEGWASVQNRVTSLSSYTSLPSDALEAYLLDSQSIKVHDLESRVAGTPGDEDFPTWQHAERTFSLMNYISNSLGVNCVFCHNSRAFYDGSEVTPQWGTEMLGISMVQELNNEYVVPLTELLPEERLGPVHADAPKVACRTCHKGYQQPLQGRNVLDNWPELATSGSPDYGN